ncbi:MAG TPA: hypothetical protein VF653_13685 [Methylomirabilota bacterium]
MADADLPVPIDIPWQLLSRRGPDSVEDPTSIATFIYVPQLTGLDEQYPDDRLIYFKFSISVFPFRLDLPRSTPLNVLDEAVAPVWRMAFDVEITPRTEAPRALKPYFLSAAPTRRALVETGVVGDYVTEGESDEAAVGRSGAHLIEGYHSTTTTRKFGVGGAFGLGGLAGGFLPIGGAIGGSYSRGTTSISGGREVSEQVDTTSRQASEERKELLSHMTTVNNVLTLLSGSLVGTNRLHFSVWPPPLRPLSVDPNDENLWYAELLKRRSSGIEGMQDFLAVAVVPRGQGFCLVESLRRVSVLEAPLPDPPVQPSVPFDRFNFNLNDFTRVFVYLDGKYPEGTPLEELDVSVEDRLVPDPAAVPPIPSTVTRAALQAWRDAVGAVWVPNPTPPLPPPIPFPPLEAQMLEEWLKKVREEVLAKLPEVVKIDVVPRPVVSGWTFSNSLPPSMFRLHALTNPPSLPVPYKWVQDVWLEAAQYDYETELAKSPLERGAILVDDRRIDICADVNAEGTVGDVTTTVPPGPEVGVLPPLPVRPVVRPWDIALAQDPRVKGRAMVSAWGTAEAQLTTRFVAASGTAAASLSFSDPRLFDIWLAHAAQLAADDPRNLPLAELARRFQLGAAVVRQLEAQNVTNLSSLAAAVLAARELNRRRGGPPRSRLPGVSDAVSSRVMTSAAAQTLARAISQAFDTTLAAHRPTRPDAARVRPRRPGRRKNR